MASCYGPGEMGKCLGRAGEERLAGLLPICWSQPRLTLGSGLTATDCQLEIDFLQSEEERQEAAQLMNREIDLGQSWPFEQQFPDQASFARYFLSHAAFTVRLAEPEAVPAECRAVLPCDILAVFYIKPNFPGRCSHVCNGGFIVREAARGNGVGERCGRAFLQLARQLGYTASLFNLVFVTNTVSDRLWRRLGFQLAGRIPQAARLRGFTHLVDANQYYYDLTTVQTSASTSGQTTAETD